MRGRRGPARVPELGEHTPTSRNLARLWNVDPIVIPHWAPPTHAMQIFRYAEQGSIKLLWIAGTNPLVSLPDLGRIRRILASDKAFVIVQDLYLTETARLADVVLPAAAWGEKPAATPIPIAPCTCRSARSIRRGRPAATWTSSWTTRSEWISATATGNR